MLNSERSNVSYSTVLSGSWSDKLDRLKCGPNTFLWTKNTRSRNRGTWVYFKKLTYFSELAFLFCLTEAKFDSQKWYTP